MFLVAIVISIVVIGYDQYKFSNSSFPEYIDLAKERAGVPYKMLFFSLPLLLSIVIDFKELKHYYLKRGWYLLTLLILIFYLLLRLFSGSDWGYILAGIIVVVLAAIILRYRRNVHSDKLL